MTTEATPRPWQRSQTDDGYWEIRAHGDGIDRALVEHVALFPIERDAQLTTDAVNAYDRLRAVADAAQRYQSAEWAFRLHEDEPVATPEHNARVDEWREADRELRAALREGTKA